MIHEDWLLSTPLARRLYHGVAKDQPIIDYHNHLIPEQLASNHRFANLHAAWLAGDHYKWRAMRMLGVEEKLITGDAAPRDKFRAFASALPYTLRNPLYHWSHLELDRYFGITAPLNAQNADAVYDEASAFLNTAAGGTWRLLADKKVEMVCTTDDPADDLAHHAALAGSDCPVRMLPGWRPDKALLIGAPGWTDYVARLAELTGTSISGYDDLLAALDRRLDHFAAHGCTISDHGLSHLPDVAYDLEVAREVCGQALLSKTSPAPALRAQTFLVTLLTDLARRYAARGWVMQLHLGALRNNNARGLRELGPDTGFDSIGDFPQASGLSRFLNHLDNTHELPKTILYNLNPADNAVFATMIGNFASGGGRGKVQWGSAWWFLDQWDGMTEQLNTLSNMGVLATFVGMLTDSRSFLSFPRHEYFRRLLCNLLGEDAAQGKIPADEALLGEIVAGVCYGNARGYFNE
ncbi:glucuronate isomerase [Neolewinella lacunae]|uniref:Uronate isomerase n=1 Tax=Neolewinella lacunae TaxID=1517758 RepID=A0A923PSX9_9BACT|nr:glucuronate isomerase [Neolewinella lacunae]MBC6996217.1 glucuronate isomerase [Neolewinella lacunae]MDN3637174.1 glucuronate isomerase [Neolewinella lacunae]